MKLNEYLEAMKEAGASDEDATVIERQPAKMIPITDQKKPKVQQRHVPITGVVELLLGNGESIFMCTWADCETVTNKVTQMVPHKRVHSPKVMAKKEQTMKEAEAVRRATTAKSLTRKITDGVTANPARTKATARQKTQQKPNTDEPTYSELKKRVEELSQALEESVKFGRENVKLRKELEKLQAVLEDAKTNCNNELHWTYAGQAKNGDPLLRDNDGAYWRALEI